MLDIEFSVELRVESMYLPFILRQGIHGQGKGQEKKEIVQDHEIVREFEISQGILHLHPKDWEVREF